MFTKREKPIRELLREKPERSLLEPVLVLFASFFYITQIVDLNYQLSILLQLGPENPSHLLHYFRQIGMINTLFWIKIIQVIAFIFCSIALYYRKNRGLALLIISLSVIVIPLHLVLLDWSAKFGFLPVLNLNQLLVLFLGPIFGLLAAISIFRKEKIIQSNLEDSIL